MSDHHQLGRDGEAMARHYFEERGYSILESNWRHSYFEIDIIASKNNRLHFIEIKTRKNNRFANPEESISNKKIDNLKNAAAAYLYQHPEWINIQFDVLSIITRSNDEVEYFLIEDIY